MCFTILTFIFYMFQIFIVDSKQNRRWFPGGSIIRYVRDSLLHLLYKIFVKKRNGFNPFVEIEKWIILVG